MYIATSIDGYIAKRNDELDWLKNFNPLDENDEDYGYQAFMSRIDTLVMGKNTYNIASSADTWPYQGKRVIVLSSSSKSVSEHAELFSGDIIQLTKKLHSEGVKHIYADGGITISQFLNAGLIDTITISIVPVILGSGILLFSNLLRESWCRLKSSKAYSNGLVQLQYDMEYQLSTFCSDC